MPCSRGRAHPNAQTKLRLFSDSGGYCQNPDCQRTLFINDEKGLHIGEMAHIFAALNNGPRPIDTLTDEQRGHYDNIVLLCPNCHSTIDKDADTYTDAVIRRWKLEHAEKLKATFGVRKFENRAELRREVIRLLEENEAVHRATGPDNDYRYNSEAPEAEAWKSRIRTTIIPNSTTLIKHLDANAVLLNEEERRVLADFKVHVEGLTLKHILGENIVNMRFPVGMSRIAV